MYQHDKNTVQAHLAPKTGTVLSQFNQSQTLKIIIMYYIPLGTDRFRDGSILLKMISNSMGWRRTDQAG
jgi:hypothetical protein